MNIKPWQIFVFSLVPLALVFAGVIGGSFWGADSGKEVFGAAPPPAATQPAGTPSAGGSPEPGGTVLTITARNLLFDKRTLTAPANTRITVRLTNEDSGVLHNIAFYRNRQATQRLTPDSVGELFAGPATRDLTFTTPARGSYFFRCDVHPDTMTGTFTVQ
ncbi:MAG TPA: cupredoxin domain-containing protein [Dehalococcoidia bacterium]|nr:cupredoxin domain-containing protein [Dehalococcoidia bacterium]